MELKRFEFKKDHLKFLLNKNGVVALLTLYENRKKEFNKTELKKAIFKSTKVKYKSIEKLIELGLVEEVRKGKNKVLKLTLIGKIVAYKLLKIYKLL